MGSVPGGITSAGLAAFSSYLPVTAVGRVVIAPVAIGGCFWIGDEVIARQNVGIQVRVAGDAGVQYGDNRTLTLRVLPRFLRIHSVGAVKTPQAGPVLIARLKAHRVQPDIRLNGFNCRVSGELVHEVIGLLTFEALIPKIDHV